VIAIDGGIAVRARTAFCRTIARERPVGFGSKELVDVLALHDVIAAIGGGSGSRIPHGMVSHRA
jgi:hypothetical protein